ncbi:hypothetical protein ACHAPU_009030 [Fusarium lateritium]
MEKDWFQDFAERARAVSQTFKELFRSLDDLPKSESHEMSTIRVFQRDFNTWLKKFDLDFDPPYPDSLEREVFKYEEKRILLIYDLAALNVQLRLFQCCLQKPLHNEQVPVAESIQASLDNLSKAVEGVKAVDTYKPMP